jgi:hypothetical protein
MDEGLAEAKLGRDNGLGRSLRRVPNFWFRVCPASSNGVNGAGLGWQNILDAVLAHLPAHSVVHTRLVQVWLQEKRRRE